MTNNSPPPSEALLQPTPPATRHSLLLPAFLVLLTIELAAAGYFVWKIWRPASSLPVTPTAKQNIPQENTPQESTTPLPTTAPVKGPGVYACDIQGVCNVFSDTRRVVCPVTYADPSCLNSCGDIKNQCPD